MAEVLAAATAAVTGCTFRRQYLGKCIFQDLGKCLGKCLQYLGTLCCLFESYSRSPLLPQQHDRARRWPRRFLAALVSGASLKCRLSVCLSGTNQVIPMAMPRQVLFLDPPPTISHFCSPPLLRPSYPLLPLPPILLSSLFVCLRSCDFLSLIQFVSLSLPLPPLSPLPHSLARSLTHSTFTPAVPVLSHSAAL